MVDIPGLFSIRLFKDSDTYHPGFHQPLGQESVTCSGKGQMVNILGFEGLCHTDIVFFPFFSSSSSFVIPL